MESLYFLFSYCVTCLSVGFTCILLLLSFYYHLSEKNNTLKNDCFIIG